MNNKGLEQFKSSFWDLDIDSLDLEKNKDFIITRLYVTGGTKGIMFVHRTYSDEEVIHAAKTMRDLNPVVANYLKTKYNLNREDMIYYQMQDAGATAIWDERDKDLGHDAPTRTRLDIAQAEYKMAKQGFEDLADDPAYLPLVAFWLATSVEMGLRHMFDMAGMDQPRTHDVDQLIRIAHEKNVDLFLPRYISTHAEMFTLWTERKDDLKYNIEREKIEAAFDGVDEYFAFIDLGLQYGQVLTTDLCHEKAARAAVEAIKNSDFRANIKSVFLFGSCARDDQNHFSDVDIGIITRPGLLDDEQIKEEYFDLINNMQSKDWDAADVEPHVFYDGIWEDRKINEYIKRDAKTLWENPDYV